MARQPFLPRYKDAGYGMGPHAIKQMPRLAELVGQCAGVWNGADFNFSLIIGSLLGAESEGSIAVFNALRQARSRRDILEAAANVALDDGDKELFAAILHLHASLDSERNAVVHGIWGESDQITDGAIWESVENHARANMAIFRKKAKGEPYGSEDLSANFFVYRWTDIEDLIERISEFVNVSQSFLVYLRYPDRSLGAGRRRRVETSPLIQEAVATLRSKAEK